MHWIGAALLVLVPLAGAGPAGRPTPTRTPGVPPPPTPSVRLTAAQKSQAAKVLSSEIARRQALRDKQGAPAKGAAGFQAHRCAVVYDESITGKLREIDGPFRVSCTDWVHRATKELSIQDGGRPCTTREYGSSLVSCTTWVDGWDERHGKWIDQWRKSSP